MLQEGCGIRGSICRGKCGSRSCWKSRLLPQGDVSGITVHCWLSLASVPQRFGVVQAAHGTGCAWAVSAGAALLRLQHQQYLPLVNCIGL